MYIKKFLLKTLYIFMGLSIIFNFNIIVFAVDDNYTWSTYNESLETSSNASNAITNNPLNLQSGAAILIDQDSGQILYEHNTHEQLRPASVTKIMSILLIMEALDSGQITLNDKVPCSEKASSMGGSQIWLTTTETLTVNEMLKCMCVVSANDCTVAMAEYLCGSTEAFVDKMNQRAKELGMNDTCFKNCHGIDEDGHVTSAYDISIMSRELLKNHPTIKNYTTIWMDSIRGGKSELVNTNKLVRNYNGCTGLKTGSTSIALYNLSASATRNNLSLIAVVLKAPTPAIRFSNAQKLLDYGFSNYTVTSFGKKGDVIKSVEIKKGTTSSIDAILENDAEVLISNGSNKDVTQEVKLDDTFNAPILEGQKLGEVEFSINGNVVSTVNLVANKSSDKLNFGSIIKFVMNKWFNMLR